MPVEVTRSTSLALPGALLLDWDERFRVRFECGGTFYTGRHWGPKGLTVREEVANA